jgi:3-oxo-5alpha-steroid 4-dehydrogenase
MGSMGDDGSGIALGQSVGAKVGYMDRAFIGRPISPPESFLCGVVVNTEGRRFVNEDAYQSIFGDILSEQPNGGEAYLILDERQFWRGVKQSFFPGKGMFKMWGAPALLNIFMGGTKRADSLQALAKKCGIDADGLVKTVSEYNSNATSRRSDTHGKSGENVSAITESSFYAVNLSLSNRFGPTFAFTLGGLVPDEDTGLVQADKGGVIKGLYVAGRAGVGLCSKGYVSGLSIADTVFSGRRAGGHAAKNAGERGDVSAAFEPRVVTG